MEWTKICFILVLSCVFIFPCGLTSSHNEDDTAFEFDYRHPYVDPAELSQRGKRGANLLTKNDLTWYLDSNGTSYHFDINVTGVWQQNLTGYGRNIAFLDTGIHRLKELKINESLSRNFVRERIPPKSHGTRVASVGAAGLNSYCGIGVAYEASIIDLQVLQAVGKSSLQYRAIALSSNADETDVFSSSWSLRDTGDSTYRPKQLELDSIAYGLNTGRHGKGSIYVWSSGNGGEVSDSCAYDGFVNLYGTVTVSGVEEKIMDGKPILARLKSGESCSAIMVTSLSKTPGNRLPPIATVGLNDSCDALFSGSSAATPMVAGALALMIQARPSLLWRDAFHILTMSSNAQLPFKPDDFVQNAANFSVSPSYGFGLLDAGKMVDMAKRWSYDTHSYTNCSISLPEMKLPLKSEYCFTVKHCEIIFLEHIQTTIKLQYKRRGHIKITLTSPFDTSSDILPGRRWDFIQSPEKQSLDVQVKSVTFWGEPATGCWCLTAEDIFSSDNEGQLEYLEIHLHGMKKNPYNHIDINMSNAKRCQHKAVEAEQTTASYNQSLPWPQTGIQTTTSLCINCERALKIKHPGEDEHISHIFWIIPLALVGGICLFMLVFFIVYTQSKGRNRVT